MRSASQEMKRRALLRQQWRDIVWCHWPVDPAQVQRILPTGLTPHLFEGRAFVGLIPFSMRDLRLAGPLGPLSRLAHIGNFGEVNVRTYVEGPDGKTGVWFCTLDADQWLSVKVANLAFGLPYRYASTQLQQDSNTMSFSSQRQCDGARSELAIQPSSAVSQVAAAGLEAFLVERYALYTSAFGRLWRGELSHEPWRVRPAELVRVVTDTVTAAGFSVGEEPHVMVGEPVEVTIFPLRRV
jgi:uncharacterized protein YqjF (DUF2071 family)